ncbi:MAG: non-ribosomal peptide synthetase, partial [bacterium]|nr:non-ribosomal peptide synthetase [bacterium]
RVLRDEQQGLVAPPMVPLVREQGLPRETVPLSFAQQRLWFLDQFEPGSSVYNIPVAVRLDGGASAALLERVFNEVVRRHEVLRTRFTTVDGKPRQVIAAELELPLWVVDLRALLPAAAGEAEARRLAAAEARRPFDLATGPLLRVTLLRLAADSQVLLVTMHHIVSDGWSMGIFRHELMAVSEAFFQGRPSPLAELPLQYADFACWQRQWLSAGRTPGEVLEAQLDYWRGELAGMPARLELPCDRPRPKVQTYRGRHLPLALSRELSEALAALSREQGATLFMTLLAGFKILLSRWSGESDVVVGSPIAGRTHRELEGLIGFFVNTLVLRTDLSGASAFDELLARVRRGALDAYGHQAVPFESLVEELAPDRDMSFPPLFQVMFALQNAPQASGETPAPAADSLAAEPATAKFDLTLSLLETRDGLRGALEYNTDLFDRTTTARLTGHLRCLLAAIADDAGQRLSELPWLTPAEQHQLRREWNDTETVAGDELFLE